MASHHPVQVDASRLEVRSPNRKSSAQLGQKGELAQGVVLGVVLWGPPHLTPTPDPVSSGSGISNTMKCFLIQSMSCTV